MTAVAASGHAAGTGRFAVPGDGAAAAAALRRARRRDRATRQRGRRRERRGGTFSVAEHRGEGARENALGRPVERRKLLPRTATRPRAAAAEHRPSRHLGVAHVEALQQLSDRRRLGAAEHVGGERRPRAPRLSDVSTGLVYASRAPLLAIDEKLVGYKSDGRGRKIGTSRTVRALQLGRHRRRPARSRCRLVRSRCCVRRRRSGRRTTRSRPRTASATNRSRRRSPPSPRSRSSGTSPKHS